MKTLFGDQEDRKIKIYRRDKNGRFATDITSRIEKLEKEAGYYKYKYEQERRKNIAILELLKTNNSKIITLKTDNKLTGRATANRGIINE